MRIAIEATEVFCPCGAVLPRPSWQCLDTFPTKCVSCGDIVYAVFYKRQSIQVPNAWMTVRRGKE
jgi:hypothetical protein